MGVGVGEAPGGVPCRRSGEGGEEPPAARGADVCHSCLGAVFKKFVFVFSGAIVNVVNCISGKSDTNDVNMHHLVFENLV